MNDYRNLLAWTLAHELVVEIFKLVRKFPVDERYVLGSQLKRAAMSIPSNVAEGAGRFSRPEFRRHVEFAAGSSKEVEYQLFLAKELGYVDELLFAEIATKLNRLQRVLRGLHKKLAAEP